MNDYIKGIILAVLLISTTAVFANQPDFELHFNGHQAQANCQATINFDSQDTFSASFGMDL